MKDSSIGSVLIDIADCELSEVEREVLAHPQVAGLVLFSRNFDSSAQLISLVKSIRDIRPNILLTVDHEGGRVQRFKKAFTRIPSMQVLADYCLQNEAVSSVSDVAWVMAAELRCHGVDLSFAPVMDVDRDRSEVIGDRSFSDDPETVTMLASAFIDGMNDAGMPATGKHFPGHGGITSDSHVDISIDSREYVEIEQHDLQPFIHLINRLGAVMPAHVIFDQVDDMPVGLSKFWINKILRERLNYQGVVVSDDLKMTAASVAGAIPERAEAAITAGCDAILVCNAFDDAVSVLELLESQSQKTSPRLTYLAKDCRRRLYPSLSALRNELRWIETQKFLERLV